MKKICIAFVIALLLWFINIDIACAKNDTTTSEAYIPSETVIDITFIETTDKKELLNLINIYKTQKQQYNKILKEFLILHGDYSIIIQQINNDLETVEIYLNHYQNVYNEIIIKEQQELWKNKEKEYPAAAKIWQELKNAGYNDYVCAGILGNIMAEVGGQTLNINYQKYSSSSKGYYGICQWSKTYKDVWNTSLDQQIKFLINTIHYELDTYGFKYQKGFKYNDFCNLANEKETALAFAKCYERCSSKSYNQRMENATIAYKYFVN